jgi:glycosyltransferase involved in cell wall biosynthesis
VNMKLSVIVPVFNEEKTIGLILQKLAKVKQIKEIIVVDDGSTDATPDAIQKFQKKIKKKRNFIFQSVAKLNGGKGSAVMLGMEKAHGDYILIQDADLEYDPDDIALLCQPVIKKKATVVYGSRFLGAHSNLLFWHRLGNGLINFVTNILYDTTLSDLETCYKLLPVKVLHELNLSAKNFDLETEITCKLLKKKVRIFEVPISYVGRDYSQGKKITWKDGVSALISIFYFRLFTVL